MDREFVSLEDPGVRLKQGFDAWDAEGRLRFRTLAMNTVFRRRATYFRVNATGKVYRVISRYKTVEVKGRFGNETALIKSPSFPFASRS